MDRYEATLKEMEGEVVPVTLNQVYPANDYGDGPRPFLETPVEDKRLYNNSSYFHQNIDKSKI